MESKGLEINAAKSHEFKQIVRKAQDGDKQSMAEIIDLFIGDIKYLSKFIMLPREEAIQALKLELINIIHEYL